MPDTMIIRPMEQRDVLPCAQLMAATRLWQRYGVTMESATARLSNALSDGATIFVAELSERPALGFVWVVLRGGFDISGYIRLIGVSPDYRGGGIGKALLGAAEAFVRPTAKDMFLLCSDFNTSAHRFYEREGYVKVGAIPDYVLTGVSEFIFRKRLVSPSLPSDTSTLSSGSSIKF